MKRDKIVKAGAGGVGALLVALSVIIGSLGSTVKVDGGYRFENSTSQTTTFVAEDLENVPDATFYDLVLTVGDEENLLGKSNFGGSGITVANICTSPIENLSVIVYNPDLEAIGVGKLEDGGTIKYDIKKEMVSDVKSEDVSE